METETSTILVSTVVAVDIRGGLGSVEEMNTIHTTINSKADMALIGRDKNSMVDWQTVQDVEDDDVLYFRCSINIRFE
jgi:hypothetical protein